jgi:hypothetical protein
MPSPLLLCARLVLQIRGRTALVLLYPTWERFIRRGSTLHGPGSRNCGEVSLANQCELLQDVCHRARMRPEGRGLWERGKAHKAQRDGTEIGSDIRAARRNQSESRAHLTSRPTRTSGPRRSPMNSPANRARVRASVYRKILASWSGMVTLLRLN